ncbi:hypothetical protein POV27_13885 [Aureisphaera galaxeae]|uniref:hypothetical protein n=1 Tax=Aureisphaera galaxeae TaxID=1538023 RepID=UPI00234FE82C|nr:hypothetical protein [Aureisphaera galaxeae]MDC8005147.1 hypothetical protein [Aureisphaera galaxeae]
MKQFLVACLCLIGTISYAQEEFNAEGELGKMIQTPNSPEAQAFGNYGSIPVNLRTGTPNISVPLYTFKGLEMDLPISLTYDIHARKVESIASGVGMGWNLNLGGRITRNVNGLADNYINVTQGTGGIYETLYKSGPLQDKYERFVDKSVSTSTTPSTSNTFADVAEANEYFQFLDRVQTNVYDLALDSHSISAPGLGDKVLMNYDMNSNSIVPIAMNDPKLKFVQSDSPASTPGSSTDWEIIDGSGNTYYFEEHETTHMFNGLDTSHPSGVPSGPTTMDYISSWLLTKIVSANGKDVYEFAYQTLGLWQQPVYTWETQRIDTWNQDTQQWSSRTADAGTSYKIDQLALKSVIHNGQTIIDITLGSRVDLTDVDNKIEKITIKSPLDGSVMNTFKFHQTYFGTGTGQYNKRLKLDKIEIGGKGSASPTYDYEKEYSFLYQSPTLMPARDSKAQDIFGCYNGQADGQDLFPAPENGQPAVPNPGGGDRSFSFNDAKIGILTQMHYPTGGYSEFNYEEHLNGNTEANGIRVASIANYSDTGAIETKKEFEYQNQHLDAWVLPDLAYSKPHRYFHNNTPTLGTQYFRSAKGVMGDQPYITYSKVVERDINVVSGNAETGRTEHVFYNNDSGSAPLGIRTQQGSPFPSEYFTHVSQGQLKEQYAYNQANNLLSKSENELDTDTSFYDEVYYKSLTTGDDGNQQLKFPVMSDPGNDGIDITVYYIDGDYSIAGPVPSPTQCVAGNNIGCINVERYARIKPIVLNHKLQYSKKTKGTSTHHLNGNPVTTASTTVYDSTNFYLPSESESTTSDNNETLVAKYKYPEDLPGDPYTSNLIADNRISAPLQTETYLREGGQDELIATQKTLLQDSGGLILPQSIQVSRRGDAPETRVQFEAYDSEGNPVQMKKANGTPTVYIWGYDFRLPVAKIENATYNQMSLISGFDLTGVNNSVSSSFIAGEIDELRQALPESMVTTFVYNEQMMVSTITDPRGYQSHFFYDDENRLQHVEDQDGHVLSNNEYNYRINN